MQTEPAIRGSTRTQPIKPSYDDAGRTLIAAYRAGCFPWPSTGRHEKALERQARRLVRTGQVPLLPGRDGLVPWVSPGAWSVVTPRMYFEAIVWQRAHSVRLGKRHACSRVPPGASGSRIL